MALLAALAAQPWILAQAWGWRGQALALPAWVTGAGIVAVGLQAASLFKSPPRWMRVALLALLGLIAPLLIYAVLVMFCGWVWYGSTPPPRTVWPGNPAKGLWDRVGLSCFAFGLINMLLFTAFDINRSSMLYFYRDRLSRLFLFRTCPDDPTNPRVLNEVDPNGADDIKLSNLNPEGSLAPYHLISFCVETPEVCEKPRV